MKKGSKRIVLDYLRPERWWDCGFLFFLNVFGFSQGFSVVLSPLSGWFPLGLLVATLGFLSASENVSRNRPSKRTAGTHPGGPEIKILRLPRCGV